MRIRFASLSVALVAFLAFHSPATALDVASESTSRELTAAFTLTQGVAELSDAMNDHLEVVEAAMDRVEDEARLARILARRGPVGGYKRRFAVMAAPRMSEASVDYGSYAGPVDPLIVSTIQNFNGEISDGNALKLAALIQVSADRYGVDPLLVTALVSQESAFHQTALSPVGATGLGQLMPETAADLGVNPHDAQENMDGCVRYLADLLYYWSASDDPTALALASYNAGAGNVERYKGIPPFEETQNYVAVIKGRYAVLSSGRAVL